MRVAVYHDADELERAGGGETDLPDVRRHRPVLRLVRESTQAEPKIPDLRKKPPAWW